VTRRGLVDSLLDYIDVDQIERLHGAEEETDGLVPKNDLLRTVPEIRRVRGWAKWLDNHPGFNPETLFSVSVVSYINVNTLPAEHFKYLFSTADVEVEATLEERMLFSFQSVDDIEKSSGEVLELDDLYFRFFPSNRLRLTIMSADSQYSSTMAVTFTPFGSKKPWYVDYQYFSELGRSLPESSTRFSESHFTHLFAPVARGSMSVGNGIW
jgi:type II secretory pathway component PulK